MSTAPKSSKACPNVSAANLAITADVRPVTSAEPTSSSMNCVLLCVALRAKVLCAIGPQFALLHQRAREPREGSHGGRRTLHYGGHQVLSIPNL